MISIFCFLKFILSSEFVNLLFKLIFVSRNIQISLSNFVGKPEICKKRFYTQKEKNIFYEKMLFNLTNEKKLESNSYQQTISLINLIYLQIQDDYEKNKQNIISQIKQTSFLSPNERENLWKYFDDFKAGLISGNNFLWKELYNCILEIDFSSSKVKQEIERITFLKYEILILNQCKNNWTCFCVNFIEKKLLQNFNINKNKVNNIEIRSLSKLKTFDQEKKDYFQKNYRYSIANIHNEFLKVFDEFNKCYFKYFDSKKIIDIKIIYLTKNLNNPKTQKFNNLIYKLYVVLSKNLPNEILIDHKTYKEQSQIVLENKLEFFKTNQMFDLIFEAVNVFLDNLLFCLDVNDLIRKMSKSLTNLFKDHYVKNTTGFIELINDDPGKVEQSEIIYLECLEKNLFTDKDLKFEKGILSKYDCKEIFIEIIMQQIITYFKTRNLSIDMIKYKIKFFLSYQIYTSRSELIFDDFSIGYRKEFDVYFKLIETNIFASYKHRYSRFYSNSNNKIYDENLIKEERIDFISFCGLINDYCILGQDFLLQKLRNFDLCHQKTENFYKIVRNYIDNEKNLIFYDTTLEFEKFNNQNNFLQNILPINQLKSHYYKKFNDSIIFMKDIFRNFNQYTLEIYKNNDSLYLSPKIIDIKFKTFIDDVVSFRYNLIAAVHYKIDHLIYRMNIFLEENYKDKEKAFSTDELVYYSMLILHAAEDGNQDAIKYINFILKKSKKKCFLNCFN
ncbi:hypothetical protein GVAV_000901 [Gurleya vavrai]